MIECMIVLGNDWRQAIQRTENALISTDSEHNLKGNIAHDISRMIDRVHEDKSRYENYQDIRTTLKFFVLQYYLRGRPLVLFHQEAPLVEASVGRIMDIAGGEKRTVLDEPFALRAAVNFFRQHDPDFHRAIYSFLSTLPNESSLGSSWDMAALPSLAHVFNNKVLSETALVPSEAAVRCDKGFLNSKARIVGLDPCMLGTDHRNMSLNEFLDAHVKNGSRSRKNGERVPAFYHPADFPSGPDIVFVLYFDNHGYCPVFVQLKLRASMNLPDTQSAFDTVKAPAIQGHLGDAKLETFCTVSPKRYIGVVIAYPAELQGVEGSFFEPRRSGRRLAGQVEDAQCISLRIDRNNIHNLFPKAHMDLLNLLKGVKRDLGPDSDNLEDEHMAKKRRA